MIHLFTADDANPDYCMYCGGSDAADSNHFEPPDTVEEAVQILMECNEYYRNLRAWVHSRIQSINEEARDATT